MSLCWMSWRLNSCLFVRSVSDAFKWRSDAFRWRREAWKESYLDGEVLKTPDVDGALLARLQVAAAHAKVGSGAYLPFAGMEGAKVKICFWRKFGEFEFACAINHIRFLLLFTNYCNKLACLLILNTLAYYSQGWILTCYILMEQRISHFHLL